MNKTTNTTVTAAPKSRGENFAFEDSSAPTTVARLQAEYWLQRARELRPVIEATRQQGEQERRLPCPVYEAMRDAGFFRLWLPRAFGGYEASEENMLTVVEEVSRYDASAGWNLAIGAGTSAVWAFLPEASARELLADDPNRMVAGGLNPARATAEPVPGGYKVSGRWQFASGCDQAAWFIGGAIVQEPGTGFILDEPRPRVTEDGAPEVRAFLIPIEECELLDTWYTTGLHATGSRDLAVEDVFVPAGRQFAVVAGSGAMKAYQPGGLYSAPLLHVFGFPLAAVALGLARDALDSFKEIATSKVPFGGRTALQAQGSTQMRFGQAEAALRSGRELLYAVARETDACLQTGRGVDDELFTSAMLAKAEAASSAVKAVDLALECAGTSSVFEGSRLERCSRDIRMIPRHMLLAGSNFEMAGRYLLGGGPPTGRP